ncbi:MAG: glycoside hydrolase family 127 protein [Defluviitaleaceae bacterium]|nr:glycoside hydrolase family 127 protein [Defluviitaleaceae bacterium]
MKVDGNKCTMPHTAFDILNVTRRKRLATFNITGGFWRNLMELARTEVIPYQWEALNDRVPDAEPSFFMQNFRVASGAQAGKHGGFVYQDSDGAKWIEAAAHSLTWHPDAELEAIVDGAIDDIVAAQQPDGYLNSFFINNGLDKRFKNLRDEHELYCLGHFLEAAIVYYKATGKDKLLNSMMKYADLIDATFGEDKIRGYCGHQEIELALVKLYDVTKNEKHLKLAKYFVDERGRLPLYFDGEDTAGATDHEYFQTHKPIREQTVAVGHAVRALYMYSGVLDVAHATNDAPLLDVCKNLWRNVINKQMYITGGVGATHHGEAFTYDYDLPNDTVYAETCASIALVFFAKRLFDIEPLREYADVMERALYNGIISGMAADGKSFFYVNPLEVVPASCEKDGGRKHVKVQRQKWFSTSCCPPNIARMLVSLSNYVFAQKDETLYLNLFATGLVEDKIEVETNYPHDGRIKITIKDAPPEKLAVRIPSWCESYRIDMPHTVQDGYAVFEGLSSGDVIELVFDMHVTVLQSNAHVRENIGKVAVMRGPVVYCLEEADNGADLHRVFLSKEAVFNEEFEPDFLGGAVILHSPGKFLSQTYPSGALYVKASTASYFDVNLKWIPYYLWANRTAGEMIIWVHTL